MNCINPNAIYRGLAYKKFIDIIMIVQCRHLCLDVNELAKETTIAQEATRCGDCTGIGLGPSIKYVTLEGRGSEKV